ncbi:hypothetical protein EV126DRAFT_436110 [Verticillium dahliae]|nr:hypothetical protein EV126DRAFT_436110 [Verticillium dahliae]
MVRFWLDFIYVYVWVLGLLNDQVLAVIFSPFIPAQSARRMPLSYIPRSSPRENIILFLERYGEYEPIERGVSQTARKGVGVAL